MEKEKEKGSVVINKKRCSNEINETINIRTNKIK
jgi:hypothetical protein